MKALLIDPFAKTISAVELENTLPAIYAVLQCDTIEEILIGHATGSAAPLYALVDEDGRLKENQRGFTVRSAGVGFAGRMLLVSSDGEEYVDCPGTDGLGVTFMEHEVGWLPDDFDFTPQEPTIVAFDSIDELQAFLSGTRH